jgi:hypothetical protein
LPEYALSLLVADKGADYCQKNIFSLCSILKGIAGISKSCKTAKPEKRLSWSENMTV